jgi:hypothetical protein
MSHAIRIEVWFRPRDTAALPISLPRCPSSPLRGPYVTPASHPAVPSRRFSGRARSVRAFGSEFNVIPGFRFLTTFRQCRATRRAHSKRPTGATGGSDSGGMRHMERYMRHIGSLSRTASRIRTAERSASAPGLKYQMRTVGKTTTVGSPTTVCSCRSRASPSTERAAGLDRPKGTQGKAKPERAFEECEAIVRQPGPTTGNPPRMPLSPPWSPPGEPSQPGACGTPPALL